jgi:hypothetical protein
MVIKCRATRIRLPQTPGAHHERRGLTATKIIKHAGLAHRRSRLTCAGSDRNSAAWVAMNASRGFPPFSPCHCVSARSPVPAGRNRVLTGADSMKKLRSDTAVCETERPSISASIVSRKAHRSRRKARMSGRSPLGTRGLSIRHQASASRSAARRSSAADDPGAATVLMRSTATIGSPVTAKRPRATALMVISAL